MLKGHDHVSDLLFSPGHAPQIEASGQLIELKFRGLEKLLPAHTQRIAQDLLGKTSTASKSWQTKVWLTSPTLYRNWLDFASTSSGAARGTITIVMRVIPNAVPTFDELQLPQTLQEIVHLRNGIALVTGPTGSGKSSTLAAIVDRMNQERAIHILTIEDPIEFLHNHKKGTVHQRELHTDTPTLQIALRAALATGAQSDPGRRNARQGNDRNCPRSCRNGPPRR